MSKNAGPSPVEVIRICPITATHEGTFHPSAHATNTLRPPTGTLVRLLLSSSRNGCCEHAQDRHQWSRGWSCVWSRSEPHLGGWSRGLFRGIQSKRT